MLDVIRIVTISCNIGQIYCCKVCTTTTESFLYIIYFGDSSTCVLQEWIISCTVVMWVLVEFRDADAKSETSMHPSLSLVRRAENMTNERKARNTSVKLDLLGSRFKTSRTKKSD